MEDPWPGHFLLYSRGVQARLLLRLGALVVLPQMTHLLLSERLSLVPVEFNLLSA